MHYGRIVYSLLNKMIRNYGSLNIGDDSGSDPKGQTPRASPNSGESVCPSRGRASENGAFAGCPSISVGRHNHFQHLSRSNWGRTESKI
jgi:hypothetical protein